MALHADVMGFVGRYSRDLVLLLMRLLLAQVFFRSGLTKWNGWFQFNPDKYDLFLYEFFCPDPIRPGALLLCDPELLDYDYDSFTVKFIEALAVVAGSVEIVVPILLVLGLFSRFSALALLGMTLFIQFAVFPSWEHWWNPAVWWAATAFVIVAMGPGRISLDRLIGLERKS
jgi:putative oxidoreductase